MDRGVFGKVKLISLDILDFKTLSRGKVTWDYGAGTKFGMINVQHFEEHTTTFQAVQFGFGHDTDAKTAAVTVTLQRSSPNGVQTLHFSHFKSDRYGHQFKVKVDDVDERFQTISSTQYFERLAELKVFASTQTFLFKNDYQDVMATNNIDLRRFLEMHLMHKPDLADDYDAVDQNLNMLKEEKETVKGMSKILGLIQKDFVAEAKQREIKAEAVQGKRDLPLLQLFYHHKSIELMRDTIEDLRSTTSRCRDIEKEELIDRLHDWDTKMEKKGLELMVTQIGLIHSHLIHQAQQIQKAKASMDAEMKALQLSTHVSVGDFSKLYLKHEHEHADLIIALDDAKCKLKQAELEKKLVDIESEMLAAREENQEDNAIDALFEKMHGKDIGIPSYDDHPMVAALKAFEHNAKDMSEAYGFASNLSVFRIPSVTSPDAVRAHMDRIPQTGHFIVETRDSITASHVSALLKDKSYMGKRNIVHKCYAFVRPNIPEMFERVSGPKDGTEVLDQNPSLAGLNKVLADTSKNIDSEIRDITEKIAAKVYLVGLKKADGTRDINREMGQLEKDVKDAETKLASKYLNAFGSNLEELGFETFDVSDSKAIIDAVALCTRYHNVFEHNEQNPRALINKLDKKMDKLKKDERKVNEQLRIHQMEQGDAKVFKALDDLLKEGKIIGAQVQDFLTKTYGQLNLTLNETIVQTKLLTVQYLAVKAQTLNLPFDPARETSAQAFLDCIGVENKPVIDANERSIPKVREIVAAKIKKIEEVLYLLELKNGYLHFNDDELDSLKKRAQKANTAKTNEMTADYRKFKSRRAAFEPQFEAFCQCFEKFATNCKEKWGMLLNLSRDELFPLLEGTIQLSVEDPLLDAAYAKGTTLVHYAAALVLRLAINEAVDSPILIIDSLDYIVEPQLIGRIMKLLEEMVDDKGIQVIFMQLKPYGEVGATSTHHMWTEDMVVDQVANTSDLTATDDSTQATAQEQSQISIRSAASASSTLF